MVMSLAQTRLPLAGMAELVDALGLGSSGFFCAGSSPVPGTFFMMEFIVTFHDSLMPSVVRI